MCKVCGRTHQVDLAKLEQQGRGDTPLIHLRYRCTRCGQGGCDSVMSGPEFRLVN